jgi:hypothetical protein
VERVLVKAALAETILLAAAAARVQLVLLP